MLDWSAAAECARAAAARWTDAPGGCFVLFDAAGPRAAIAGGLASLEHRAPFTADTATRYASISKHMLAAALLLEGVDLDTPLGAALPLRAPVAEIPLGRALDMTAGLPDLMELLWQRGVPFTATLPAATLLGAACALTATSAPPGTEMAYSNTGWRLGQAVLEARTGEPYPAFLRRRLMQPEGLGIVLAGDETEFVPSLAAGYWREGDTWRRGRYGLNFSASGGAAGTAHDLARWAAALLAGRGPLAGMLAQLAAPRAFADGSVSAYRLGLVATTLGATGILAHSGALPGYRNHLLLAPGRDAGVLLLLNRDEDPLIPALQVMAALLGEPAPAPAAGLPAGLYAAADGPAWALLQPGAIEFMGGTETLIIAGDRARSFPSALEINVAITPDAINGRIGGVARTLHRVAPDDLADTPLDPALTGTWHEAGGSTELLIRADGTARWPGPGGLGTETTLTALPGPRAIATLQHLMWRHRPCLWLQDGTLHVASHRARTLRLSRQG